MVIDNRAACTPLPRVQFAPSEVATVQSDRPLEVPVTETWRTSLLPFFLGSLSPARTQRPCLTPMTSGRGAGRGEMTDALLSRYLAGTKTAMQPPCLTVRRTAIERALGTDDRLAVTRESLSADAAAGNVKKAKAPRTSARMRIASGTCEMFLTAHAGPIVRKYCRGPDSCMSPPTRWPETRSIRRDLSPDPEVPRPAAARP
jgi:hypothetical protein